MLNTLQCQSLFTKEKNSSRMIFPIIGPTIMYDSSIVAYTLIIFVILFAFSWYYYYYFFFLQCLRLFAKEKNSACMMLSIVSLLGQTCCIVPGWYNPNYYSTTVYDFCAAHMEFYLICYFFFFFLLVHNSYAYSQKKRIVHV